MQFNGFGALKELLLPLDNRSAWSAEDLRYEPEVKQFHELLRNRFGDRYDEAVSSLKNSILTSFYTPAFITDPIVEAIQRNSESIDSILEPAAGTGLIVPGRALGGRGILVRCRLLGGAKIHFFLDRLRLRHFVAFGPGGATRGEQKKRRRQLYKLHALARPRAAGLRPPPRPLLPRPISLASTRRRSE